MANVNGGLVTERQNSVKYHKPTVRSLLANHNFKKRFEDILGEKASSFMSSVINIANTSGLRDCEPMSIISGAVVAATLDLPIDSNLSFAYIVPYNDKKKGKIAQFQIGYKGFIQLAMRSGQYKTISSSEVYEDEIKKYNRITGDIEFNEDFVINDDSKVVGYIAYFRLLNGFEKYLYMTVEQLEKHGKRYSQSYKSKKQWVRESCLWSTNFETMATKTVLKLLLSKYGILSIEMQRAIRTDQAVISEKIVNEDDIDNASMEYIDNQENNITQDVDFEDVTKESQEEEIPECLKGGE